MVRRVLIVCAAHNDWLYPEMMRILRDRFGTTFYLVMAADRITSFQHFLAEGDKAVPVTASTEAVATEPEFEEDIFAKARALEERYGLSFMRDIVQPDHGQAASFLNYAPNSTFQFTKAPEVAPLIRQINSYFRYYGTLFEQERFDLIINRPGGMEDNVMVAVAQARGIPVSFFHGSYFGSRAQWASGPLMGDAFVRTVYEATPELEPVSLESLQPNATWTVPPPPALKPFLVSLAKLSVVYGEHWLSDMRRRCWSRRVPYWHAICSEVRQFKTRRYVEKVAERDLARIDGHLFIYVAMPHEPEYTVQSLCREFADPTALFRQLALALPAGVKLVLKEHQRVGNRKQSYYDDFMRFPNVVLAHPSLRGVDLIARCAATATMGGSTPVEAAQFGKPSIVFGNRNPYSFLPSIRMVDNPRNLVEIVREALAPRSEEERLAYRIAASRFRAALETVSFDVSNTVLFRSGTKRSIPLEETERATDILLQVAEAQRERLATNRPSSGEMLPACRPNMASKGGH